MRPRRLPLALLAAGAVGATGAAVAAADGRCGSQACVSDVSVSGHAEPQPVNVGGTSRYRFTVRNNGPDGTEGVEFQTTIPDGLTVLGVRTYGAPSCSASGQFVQCQLGAFAKLQQAVVEVEVKSTRTGTFIAPAKVYGAGSNDPNGGNGQVSATLGVLPKGAAGGPPAGSTAGGRLKVADPQRPLKSGGVNATVVAYRSGTLRLRGTVHTDRGTVKLTSVTIGGVRSGETKRIFLGTSTTALSRIRAALRGGKRLRTVISGSVGSRTMRTEIHLKR